MTAPLAVPVWLAALRCRCPRCGQGKLFQGVLTVRERCPVCGLDLREHDSGDGPTPDPDDHPALRRALDAIEGVSSDELFATFLRTYLDSILREVPK